MIGKIWEDWPFLFIQTAVFVFFAYLCFDTFRQDRSARERNEGYEGPRDGTHWLSTLIVGALFGYTLEMLIVSGDSPAYSYACDKFLCFNHAPLWVGLGWGIVAYASVWTSHKMQFQWMNDRKEMVLYDPWWGSIIRIISAGFLAVTIDITLDPVAQLVGLWDWKCDCLLGLTPNLCPVPCLLDSTVEGAKLRFYDVPFDNFVGGWFGITAAYSGSVALMLWVGRKIPNRVPAWFRNIVVNWLVAVAAAGVALGSFWLVLRPIAIAYYEQHPTDGQMMLFLFAALVAGLVTAYHAGQTKLDAVQINWGIALVPIFFNSVPYVLLVTKALRKQPALLVSVPAYLLVGVILFTWPFLAFFKKRVLEWIGGLRNAILNRRR